ncbi:hypothetical protein PCC79_03010 [Propioniciclava soli]|uniref:Uncharacterized protein n=1 Tax=Propioniciclava soli TaxID=2775081 RepID=A0ABZ3CBP4_9ACTN
MPANPVPMAVPVLDAPTLRAKPRVASRPHQQAERWISTLSALNPRRPNSIASATATQAAGDLGKVTPDRA